MSQGPSQIWMNSLAHLELLSKFLKPLSIYYIPESYREPDWYNALKEGSLGVITKFIEEGYLVRPRLDQLVEYNFKVTELKQLCSDRGLPVSGKKGDLIKRLITADEPSMQREVSDLQVVVCSDKGRKIAQAHLDMRKKEREEAERLVIDHLINRNFLQAQRTVSKYEQNQIFPRGLGIDWAKLYTFPNPREAHILRLIFEEIPTIAIGVNLQKLDEFRLAAGLIYLWGSEVEARRMLEGLSLIHI